MPGLVVRAIAGIINLLMALFMLAIGLSIVFLAFYALFTTASYLDRFVAGRDTGSSNIGAQIDISELERAYMQNIRELQNIRERVRKIDLERALARQLDEFSKIEPSPDHRPCAP